MSGHRSFEWRMVVHKIGVRVTAWPLASGYPTLTPIVTLHDSPFKGDPRESVSLLVG